MFINVAAVISKYCFPENCNLATSVSCMQMINVKITVVCISLETRSIASQPSVAVGWVKIKVWSMPHLKGLTANFKLM